VVVTITDAIRIQGRHSRKEFNGGKKKGRKEGIRRRKEQEGRIYIYIIYIFICKCICTHVNRCIHTEEAGERD